MGVDPFALELSVAAGGRPLAITMQRWTNQPAAGLPPSAVRRDGSGDRDLRGLHGPDPDRGRQRLCNRGVLLLLPGAADGGTLSMNPRRQGPSAVAAIVFERDLLDGAKDRHAGIVDPSVEAAELLDFPFGGPAPCPRSVRYPPPPRWLWRLELHSHAGNPARPLRFGRRERAWPRDQPRRGWSPGRCHSMLRLEPPPAPRRV